MVKRRNHTSQIIGAASGEPVAAPLDVTLSVDVDASPLNEPQPAGDTLLPESSPAVSVVLLVSTHRHQGKPCALDECIQVRHDQALRLRALGVVT